ncbi:MAG: OmpA family protein [Rhodospirillum sp.]|nr:OmpA family protein [Rhodospirillum sp.]MCF8488640.1 OmpA family protein [Rhodospirillum sp.]MCF8500685.1 OmpA family protein [Rhodospirillum sp.]
MTKTFKIACLVGAVALLPAVAQAQTPEGAYVAIQGGVNFNVDNEASAAGVSGDVETNVGYAAGAAAGYAFGGGPRIELETTWRSNGVDSVGGFGSNGDLNSVSVMANAIYDVPLGMDFYPYVGAGVGMSWVMADMVEPSTGLSVNDDDIAFAYQGIAGVGYNVTENVGVTLDYRFLGTTGLQFNSNAGNVDYDAYYNHTVMVGLRYSFTKPAPMVEEVVAEQVIEVPESYLVFFDFDSSAITPEAAGIVGTAATNAKATGSSMIEVTGHADRSGPSDYNMGLSLRRAEAVLGELERNGIPRSDVAVYAKGETDPLVPTPDGVREPQNRRVVIVLK